MPQLVWRDSAFGSRLYTDLCEEGTTILEMVDRARNLPPGFAEFGIAIVSLSRDGVLLRDDEIPREMWHLVRPRTRDGYDITVRLGVRLQGGGSGKNIVATLATVAVLAAGALISGGLLGPLLAGGIGIGNLTWAGVVGAAVSLGGSLAIAALTPPPTLTPSSAAPTAKSDAVGASAASLSGNVLSPGGSIPRVIGTRRIYPPLATHPLIDFHEDEQQVEALFVLAGPHSLDDIRVGDALVSEIPEIDVEYTTWPAGVETTPKTFLNRYSITDSPNIQLTGPITDTDTNDRTIITPVADNIPQWHSLSLLRQADEVWINLAFPEGLVDTDELTGRDFAMRFRVRIRQEGSVTWSYFPELVLTSRKTAPFERDVRIIFDEAGAAGAGVVDYWREAYTGKVPMRVAAYIHNGAYPSRAFNGQIQVSGNCWTRTSAASGYIGADFLEATRTVSRVDIYPSTDAGFTNVASITINLRGSTSAPGSASDGTLLGTTGSIADTTSMVSISSTDTTSLWRYLWLELIPVSPSGIVVSEILFYDAEDKYSWPGASAGISAGLAKHTLNVWLSPAYFPKENRYEIQLKRSCSYRYPTITKINLVEGYSCTEDPTAASVTDLFAYLDDASNDPYVAHATANVHDRVVVDRIAHVFDSDPVPVDGLTQIRLRATGRAIEDFNVLASGLVYDAPAFSGATIVDRGAWRTGAEYAVNDRVLWDGASYLASAAHSSDDATEPGVGPIWATVWNTHVGGSSIWDTLVATSNPAPHYRDVLAGALAVNPVPDDLVDEDALLNWRERCEVYGYECNMVVEGRSVPDVLNAIAGTGFARPRQSEKFGVIMDYDRSSEAPVQLFSPRNMRGFSWARAFGRVPDGVRATFENAASNYQPDERIMLYDGATDTGNYDVIAYDGLVTVPEIQRRANFDLEQRKRRFVFYSGESPIEWIVARRGDLCGISYDVIDRQHGAARVSEVLTSAGNVTGLVLDGTIPSSGGDIFFTRNDEEFFTAGSDAYFLGGDWGAMIRAKDQSYWITAQIDPADSDTSEVSFTTPFTDPGIDILDVDCLCVFGELGREVRRVIVSDISPQKGMTAKITFVDEAPELWPINYEKGLKMKVAQVTLTLNTSIYATGDLMFDAQVVSNLFRVTDGFAELDSITVIDEDDQGTAIDIYFTNLSTSWGTENSVPTITDAVARGILTKVSVAAADFYDLGGVRVASIKNIGAILQAASGTKDCYIAGIVISGTPTYSASGVRLNIGVKQN